MKKYEMLEREENGLCRIRALKDFANVKNGDIGGYIEKESNLSQIDNCWIYDDAMVSGNATVSDDAKVSDDAMVYRDAMVSGNATVSGNAKVSGDAMVYRDAKVSGEALVYGKAKVSGDAIVSGNATVSGNCWVYGKAKVSGDAKVSGEALVYGKAICTKKVINIIGLVYNITITDNYVQIGCKQFTLENALKLNARWKITKEKYGEAVKIEYMRKVIVEAIKLRLKEELK